MQSNFKKFVCAFKGHEALFPIGTTLKEVRTAFSKSGGFVKKKEVKFQRSFYFYVLLEELMFEAAFVAALLHIRECQNCFKRNL